MGYVDLTKKTTPWVVFSKDYKGTLGNIRWNGAWRKYCFYPHGNTVYDHHCLREIADFTSKLTTDYLASKKATTAIKPQFTQ